MIDLHIHIDGSLEPEDICTLAECSGVTLESTDPAVLRKQLSVAADCTSLAEYLEKFSLPMQVMQTEEAVKQAVICVLRRLAREGLCYTELRFAPQFHLSRGLTQRQVVEAAIAGLKEAEEQFHLPAQLILCCMRSDNNHSQNLETIQLAAEYLGRGVCAADLAGDEAAWPNEMFADVFRLAEEKGLPFVLHSGEADGAQSVKSAIAMHPRRIGHGVRAIEDPEVVQELVRTRIPIETCFTSNLNTKCARSPEEYPLKKLLDAGVRATINTDNTSVSHTCLHQEYRRVQQLYGFDTEQMQQFALTAADVTLLPEAKKEELRGIIRSRFAQWLESEH